MKKYPVSCEECQKMHDSDSDDVFESEDGYFYCYEGCAKKNKVICDCGKQAAIADGEPLGRCVDCLTADDMLRAECRMEEER